jgi:hypothetical protein
MLIGIPRHSAVLDEIAAERQRQLTIEGWTEEHEGRVSWQRLLPASLSTSIYSAPKSGPAPAMPHQRPTSRCGHWDDAWWKPRDGRQNLILAAALIVAAIERLDRAEARI